MKRNENETGPSSKLETFFSEINRSIPANWNPCEYMITLVNNINQEVHSFDNL